MVRGGAENPWLSAGGMTKGKRSAIIIEAPSLLIEAVHGGVEAAFVLVSTVELTQPVLDGGAPNHGEIAASTLCPEQDGFLHREEARGQP
eukprot:COSAG01_NODE_1086_length_11792_cov_20.173694_3_plen_90_part_00